MATEWSDTITICDLTDEPEFSEEITEVTNRLNGMEPDRLPHVILNMDAVTYLNSSNLAQLLRLRRVVTDGDKRLALCAVADTVWSIMLLTGLDKVFTFVPDKALAIASVQIDD